MHYQDSNSVRSTKSPAGYLAWLLASGLGAGLSPVVPGTVGSLWGVPVAWCVLQLPGWQWPGLAMALLVGVGVPICTCAARDAGGAKDPGWIVWDEIASFPLVFWGLPWTVSTVAAGFVLHRVCDILKPPPARQLERLPTGWGIMADDVAAAIYARLLLGLLVYLGWV